MKPLFARAGYLLSLLLLSWLLGSCTVYDHFFHPHRLGTPPMTASAKAKYKAAEKARHKGLTLGAPATDGTAKPANADASAASDGGGAEPAAPAAEPAPAAPDSKGDAKDKTKTYNELPDNIRNTYDKKLLLKRSVWQRMQYSGRKLHHYDTHPLSHTKATRDERKLRKHPKGKGKAAPGPKDGAELADAAPEPAPDPTQPAEAPPAAAAKPGTKAKPAARPALKPRPAAKPAPTPKVSKTPPTEGMLPGTGRERPAAVAEPAPAKKAKPEEKKEKPAKVKKPKRDKNGNKLPKPDPTQPLTGED